MQLIALTLKARLTDIMKRPIDTNALQIPLKSGLCPCLYVPIGARDVDAIEQYVGRVVKEMALRAPLTALFVEAYLPDEIDFRLPIWSMPESKILHCRQQVWVHVDYSGYRSAYQKAFPDACLKGMVLDHVLNRRIARLKGFGYLRIVPVTRAVNSSHGSLSEDWGVKYHSTSRMREINEASLAAVQYADLSDIVKMLNVQGGGSLMDYVNEAQAWVDAPKSCV